MAGLLLISANDNRVNEDRVALFGVMEEYELRHGVKMFQDVFRARLWNRIPREITNLLWFARFELDMVVNVIPAGRRGDFKPV